ncbi:hypothetical protein ESY86_00495 [Subsaximicrobium wynnwilliamsii]|uniref:Uncharacterized protein n=1 Tax=Subsaximicrobium wynnwilliamsii TaxID=291179 RepID=A0A5C6ZL85_9FLAO|nr:hypothetical protein [Subsaximicrobium wynnwilliamsii]TXD85065.1 hypothetical protein ESY87_01665 [Subsaximicrobium wynnwilliamsii]TXD91108.1 hypothetical protein ESY86_00495 [Subsaximicrobium wynnwilliamsii]TXE04502.1 hypothetical protein ESY88_03145 [Subsaximicrobium wynnwilliamsii]
MSDLNYIETARKLSNAENYTFLRSEGQKHIEILGNELWTDFNAHDPGITILEVLCYVITELGYRANFSIEDLLTGKDHKISNATFFPCSEIMTNAPLTELDYRKLIIDVEGVNNAWFVFHSVDNNGEPTALKNEVRIYVNFKEDKLSLSSVNKFGETLLPLRLEGLARPIVELSDDRELGQLNEVAVQYSWTDGDRFIQVDIKSEIESWGDEKVTWLEHFSNPANIAITDIGQEAAYVRITTVNNADPVQSIQFNVFPYDISEVSNTETHFSDIENLVHIVSKFNEKRKKVNAIYSEVKAKLNKNRNLTEDWLCLETITNLDIGICMDVQLSSGTDAEEALANIYQTVDGLLDPPIRFYTLRQMLDLDYKPRDIFKGPSLDHGFLIDSEVDAAQLPDCIHASDIIAAIMGVEGVELVRNLLMTAYDINGKPIEGKANQNWCIHLSGAVRPVFQPRWSKILLFRDSIPFVISQAGENELDRGIFYLKVENNNYKLKNPKKDFEFPAGKHYQLNDYYSIQHDFPSTYGIGEGELPLASTNLRKAQAKQLKAYLLHFDQLLADFFKQLYMAKEYLNTTTLTSTYATNLIKDIPGIADEFFYSEAYDTSFETGIINGGNERSHYETNEDFYDRRNRFLDHLLARFGESFGDYVFMMYRMQENAKGISELKLPLQDLVEDKQRFLNKVADVSYSRGLGVDYDQEPDASSSFWMLPNRSGFANRISALLGINQIPFQDIVDTTAKDHWIIKTETKNLPIKLMNPPGFTQDEKWNLVFGLFNDIRNYQTVKFTNTYIYFVDFAGVRIARFDETFDSVLEAEEFIPSLFQFITGYLENFYCVEHVLLRPFFTDGLTDIDLFPVCLNDECVQSDLDLFYANQDPFSFKATLIFPGWLPRFGNRYFRKYAENLIRKEAPAHTQIKICWVGKDDMIAFQQVYQPWLHAFREMRRKYCNSSLSNEEKTRYNSQLSNMMKAMKALNTIFEKGTLHDCLESELDNPIILNNSTLGTL